MRPVDVARKIHEKQMICEMGSFLDCYIAHTQTECMTQTMARVHRIDALVHEETFLYTVDMASRPIHAKENPSKCIQ